MTGETDGFHFIRCCPMDGSGYSLDYVYMYVKNCIPRTGTPQSPGIEIPDVRFVKSVARTTFEKFSRTVVFPDCRAYSRTDYAQGEPRTPPRRILSGEWHELDVIPTVFGGVSVAVR